MALDAIAEFVVRAVAQFIIEFLFVGVFYWPGWLILRVFTFGRYPPPQSRPHNREFVAMVAFAVLMTVVTIRISSTFA